MKQCSQEIHAKAQGLLLLSHKVSLKQDFGNGQVF